MMSFERWNPRQICYGKEAQPKRSFHTQPSPQMDAARWHRYPHWPLITYSRLASSCLQLLSRKQKRSQQFFLSKGIFESSGRCWWQIILRCARLFLLLARRPPAVDRAGKHPIKILRRAKKPFSQRRLVRPQNHLLLVVLFLRKTHYTSISLLAFCACWAMRGGCQWLGKMIWALQSIHNSLCQPSCCTFCWAPPALSFAFQSKGSNLEDTGSGLNIDGIHWYFFVGRSCTW